MLYGTIKHVAQDRGFGFIQRDFGLDVYFHATVVEGALFERIRPEQPVMYELAKRDRESKEPYKPKATIVKLIDRIPGGLLPDPPQSMRSKHHPKARRSKPKWRRTIGEEAPAADAPAAEGTVAEPLPPDAS